MHTINNELSIIRQKSARLLNHSSTISLVYSQVVCIATYTYFFTALIAHQHVNSNLDADLDKHPFLLTLEFVIYMGWLKVAEQLINPFGNDDDDFDVNLMIDRNLQMSYVIVDEKYNEHPEILKDQYWDEILKSLPDKKQTKNRRSSIKNRYEIDIVNYEVRDSSTMSTETIRNRTENDIEIGRNDGDLNSRLKNFIPDPNVISDIYKNIPDVEVEQNFINHEIKKRKKSISYFRNESKRE